MVQIEQCFQSNSTRQSAELIIDQNRLPGSPGIEHPLGEFTHDGGVRLYASLEEDRLNKLSLSMPILALARNQSVPKHWLVGSGSEVLDVVLSIRNQHLFDEIGCACQKYPARTNAEARKRAIVSGCFEQKVEQAGAL